MCSSAPFRAPAPERRTTTGLAVRYAVWLAVVLALAVTPARNLVSILTD